MEKVLALVTNDCVYEDVTFGVVNRGKAELRMFASGVFAGVPDFKIQPTSQFIADTWASVEWTMSGTHKGDLPGMPATGKRFSAVRGTSNAPQVNSTPRRCTISVACTSSRLTGNARIPTRRTSYFERQPTLAMFGLKSTPTRGRETRAIGGPAGVGATVSQRPSVRRAKRVIGSRR